MRTQDRKFVTLDASLALFAFDHQAARNVLLVFLESAAPFVHELSIDPISSQDPTSEQALRAQGEVERLAPRRRRWLVATDVVLDSGDDEMRILFATWSYWSIEATVVGHDGHFLFELTDGGDAADYRLPHELARSFISRLRASGTAFPVAWLDELA